MCSSTSESGVYCVRCSTCNTFFFSKSQFAHHMQTVHTYDVAFRRIKLLDQICYPGFCLDMQYSLNMLQQS